MGLLSNKTVIVTGASQGIGFAVAELFLEKGWRIISCSRSDIPPDKRNHKNWLCHLKVDLSNPDYLNDFVNNCLLSTCIEKMSLLT